MLGAEQLIEGGWLVADGLSDLRPGPVGSLFLGTEIGMVDSIFVFFFGAVNWAVLTMVALSRSTRLIPGSVPK